jgi:hypothetical protein
MKRAARFWEDGGVTSDVSAADPSLYQRLRHEFVTPESIYGTILVSALIVIVEDDESDFSLLVTVATSSFVFWIAHVFAATVANHGKRFGKEIPLGEALAHAVRHSAGLLTSAILPVLMLALGAFGVISESLAYDLALAVGVVVLVALGWLAFAERGARWYSCLLGGVVTGLLGLAVILLKAVLH